MGLDFTTVWGYGGVGILVANTEQAFGDALGLL